MPLLITPLLIIGDPRPPQPLHRRDDSWDLEIVQLRPDCFQAVELRGSGWGTEMCFATVETFVKAEARLLEQFPTAVFLPQRSTPTRSVYLWPRNLDARLKAAHKD